MSKTGAERNRVYEEKLRASGFKRRWVWIHENADWEKIKKYVEQENKKAEGGCQQ